MDVVLTPGRIRAARAIAMLADLAEIVVFPAFMEGFLSPANDVLERCVLDHPSRTIGDAQQSMEGAAHSGMLIDLMHECVAAAVLECAPGTPSR
jgi:hypothetical protein